MTIIPISDLRQYNQALSTVTDGSQVILTKNGNAQYTVVDYEEWKRKEATLELFSELQKGVLSLQTEPTHTLEDFRKRYAKHGI